MTAVMEPEGLSDLIHSVTVRITQQVGKIHLQLSEHPPDMVGDLCSVYTTVEGAYRSKLILFAERDFLYRLTENMLGDPASYPEDLEEYSKEFFNILCGQIVGEIFRRTKAGASFRAPSFVPGCCPQEEPDGPRALICFTSDREERIVIVHDEIQCPRQEA